MRVVATDAAGWTTISPEQHIAVDKTPPVISIVALNEGDISTVSNFVLLGVAATDGIGGITDVCAQLVTATPAANAPCWTAVPTTHTLALAGQYFRLDFIVGVSQTVYVWTRDAVGHVSAPGSASITFNPAQPPTLDNINVANNDTVALPSVTTRAEREFASGAPVYIKWNASDDIALRGTNPIELTYSTDDVTYVPIAVTTNSAPSGCSLGADYTGCYLWSAPTGPTNSYFRVRVRAYDNEETSTSKFAPPANMGRIRLLAGNVDAGTDSSASSSMFFLNEPEDPRTFAIAPDGTTYVLDRLRGLLRIDPIERITRVLVPASTAGGYSAYEGPLPAHLYSPRRMALQYDGTVLVLEPTRIRKIDPVANTISTLVGAGAVTGDADMPASDLAMRISESGGFTMLRPFPNGDVWFDDNRGALIKNGGGRLRKLHAGTVSTLVPSGTFVDSMGTTRDVSECYLRDFAVEFDVVTSAVTALYMRTYHPGPPPVNCPYQSADGLLRLDPVTGAIIPHHHVRATGREYYGVPISGQDGRLYMSIDSVYGALFRVDHVGADTASTLVLGQIAVGTTYTIGSCDLPHTAAGCHIDPQDMFVAADASIYYVERGAIRTITASNDIAVVYGQSFSYGDGKDPLSARFHNIYAMGRHMVGGVAHDILHDQYELRWREITYGASPVVQTIAGNGEQATQYVTSAAPTDVGLPGSSRIIVDPLRGDVYVGGTAASGAVSTPVGIVRLNRASNQFESVFGAPASTGAWAWAVTGVTGWTGAPAPPQAAIGTPAKLVRNVGYPPVMMGFANDRMIFGSSTNDVVGSYKWGWVAELRREADASFTYNGIRLGPSDAWIQPDCYVDLAKTAITCNDFFGAHSAATYESNQWILGSQSTKPGVWAIASTGPTGASVFATIDSASYVTQSYSNLGGIRQHVYCRGGRLYQEIPGPSNDITLPWPVPAMSCSGLDMSIYEPKPGKRSAVFSYTQNSLAGIAEYCLEPLASDCWD